VIELFDECGNVVFSKSIAPHSSGFDLGTITATVAPASILTISGKLVNCSNATVSNGVATVIYNDIVQQVACDNNGNFSTTYLQCTNGGNVSISGEDNTTHQSGNLTTFPLISNNLDVGNIVACGNLLPFNVSIQGKLVDCNNAAVTSGYASVVYSGVTYVVACNNTGSFSVVIFYNPNPDTSHICQISGLDATAGKQGSPANFTLSSLLNNNVANVGNIVACGSTANSSMSYTIDGSTNVLFDAVSGSQAYSYAVNDSSTTPYTPSNNIYISSFSNYSPHGIAFSFLNSTLTTGMFSVSSLYLYEYGYVTLILPFNITLTNFPAAIGDNYTGSFSGQFKDAENITHTVSCSFNEARTN
jgi:hypothetical protein